MNVRESGIDEGISEVIVTTRSASGTFNAAPIGIITTTNEHFVKLYKRSRTFTNVQETKKLAANITSDTVLFVKAALDNLGEAHYSSLSSFPVLKEANSWILFQAVLAEKSTEYSLFQLTPLTIKINRKELKAINRGRNAVIEATILATRYLRVNDEREKEELKKQMARYAKIAEKCGGHREKEAIRILEEKPFVIV
ncbi:DUF447 domain-containing protein [ANME-1 cluster archaeon AG-394-G06]|nr:DUF447 domain-containing protein [ANME-1 cluster archaeon AG-394-G06]